METKQNVSRRKFLKLTGMTGAVLAIGSYLPVFGKDWEVIDALEAESKGIELNAFITIDTTGKVTIVNHRAEMGQGTFQSIPQIIAEELEVNMNAINIVFADGNERKYGGQTAGGSSSIRTGYKRLSRLGATAREMLIEAASKKWNVNKNECYAEEGQVFHKPTGKKLGYGELVEEASKLKPASDVKLKYPEQYKILRKPLPRRDTPLKTNGEAIFGIDKKLPGMLYAVVERSPRFNGKVKSIDDAETKKVPGVKHVVKVNREVFGNMREGVAVVADSTWAAMQGRKVLKVDWDDSGFEHHNTDQLFAKMREDVKRIPNSMRTQGNFKAAFEKAELKVEALYETPYESHSCMEPLNCIANVTADGCEVWGPIQGPGWIQGSLSQHLGLPMEKVKVNLTFLGGGFGRKAFPDYPYEAAMLSKELNVPIQVIWTREDDMTAGPFRPGAVYSCKAGLSANGRVQAFETIMAAQNMDLQGPAADRGSYNRNTTEGLLEPYFDSFPHYSFGDVPLDAPIPVMWWRSVYSSTNAFAYESFMDELAIKADKDPLEFRKQHLRNPRYQSLISKIEEVSGWKNRKKNEGFGIAITECFSSIVAEVVKVSKKADGKVKIDKVWAVMDCGWYVNPDIIAQQVEGSIIMALGAAIKHGTHFADGKAVEKNFDTYKMPRISDTPEIEVHVMDNDEDAGGVGEPALPPFAPALANAIFDLTGKRMRTLPFNLDEV